MLELIEFLKSDGFESYANTVYNYYSEKLNMNIKGKQFATFLKAYVLDIYDNIDDENKNKFIEKIQFFALTAEEIEFLIFKLNACLSKPNDHINKDSEEFFEELESYKDNSIFSSLAQYRKEIFKVLSTEMGVYTIKQIKAGDYHIPEIDLEGHMGEYFLDDNEIETIEKAHKASLLVDLGHSLYDDIEYIQRPTIFGNIEMDKHITCDYEKADNDGLGNIIFNTLKDEPKIEIDIVFEDGIIMQYHKGNIRRKQYTINEMMTYIYADIVMRLEKLGFDENNISAIDPDELESMIDFACMEITAQSDYLGEIYSKKMIDSSKKYIKKLAKISKEENL